MSPLNLTAQQVLDVVGPILERHRRRATEPSLSWGVVVGGRLLTGAGSGPVAGTGAGAGEGAEQPGVDTVFRIASMTKSFTAATVLALRDEGLLALDDPAVQYVPELAATPGPTSDCPPISLRHLLTMTAGLPTDDPWGDRQQDLPGTAFGDLLRDGLSLAWAPGTRYEYSNTGYAVLGRVIAAAAGAPYEEVVVDRLLRPLGMRHTGFRLEDLTAVGAVPATGRHRHPGQSSWYDEPPVGYGAYAPMGGLFSTVSDLATWVAWLMAAHPARDDHPADTPVGLGGPVLGRASRREMAFGHAAMAPVVLWSNLGSAPVIRSSGYGFGLRTEADPRTGTQVWHNGGYPGFGSSMRWHPATGLGVITLANGTYAPMGLLGREILEGLLSAHVPERLLQTSHPWPGPESGTLASQTDSARLAVNELIRAWDDVAAAELFASNVDQDRPLELRRQEIVALTERLGPFEPDDEPVTAGSTADASWWLRGPGGRVRVTIQMTPERPSRVQTLTLTEAAHPGPELLALAENLIIAINTGQAWTSDDVTRQLRVAAAWAGTLRRGPVLAGDGVRSTTLRLDGERCRLTLELTLPTDAQTDGRADTHPDAPPHISIRPTP